MDPLTLEALERAEWIPLFRAAMSVALVGVAFLYLRSARRRRGLTLDLCFSLSLAAAVLSLHYGVLFHDVAACALERTEIPAALRDADDRIERVESMPSDWWRSFQGSIGFIREDARPEPPELSGEERVGARIHAALVSMIAVALRAAVWAFASLSCGMLLGLRALAGRRSDPPSVDAMQRRVLELEEELARLQKPEEPRV